MRRYRACELDCDEPLSIAASYKVDAQHSPPPVYECSCFDLAKVLPPLCQRNSPSLSLRRVPKRR